MPPGLHVCLDRLSISSESKQPGGSDYTDGAKRLITYAVGTLSKTLRRSLGVGGTLTVLGDGAAWIWAMGLFLFGKVAECLDVFHALENISKCGKVIYKDAKKFQCWFEEMRLVLLKDGFAGIDTRLQTLLFDERWLDEDREAVQSLRDYWDKHKGRMNYRERLAQGRARIWWEGG